MTIDAPEFYAPRARTLTPHEAAVHLAALTARADIEAAARAALDALTASVAASLTAPGAPEAERDAAVCAASTFTAGAAVAAAECLRVWVAWCETALAVRVAAAHTATFHGASPDARGALASAHDAAAALLCAHAAATITDAPPDAARARSWTRTVGALVALAAGEGPYGLAAELPEATTHPRVAEALAAPVLAACAALESLALTLDAAREAEASRPCPHATDAAQLAQAPGRVRHSAEAAAAVDGGGRVVMVPGVEAVTAAGRVEAVSVAAQLAEAAT